MKYARERREMHTKFWSDIPKERDHSEDLGVDGRIILERTLENRVQCCGLDSTRSGQRPVAVSCEHSNKLSVSIKDGEFLD
jgi:hypothetical protein